MKKVLTLVLALVFVLALAAPAMAFTGDTTPAAPVPYKLNVYLVEHKSEDIFTGWIGLPAVDTGYVTGQKVAAVVEVFCPKGEKLGHSATPVAGEGPYNLLQITAKNATFKMLENGLDNVSPTKAKLPYSKDVDVTPANRGEFAYVSDTELTRAVNLIQGGTDAATPPTAGVGADTTYKYLVFAQVTADNASITAKLAEDAAPVVNGTNFKLNGKTFSVAFASNTYTLTSVDAPKGAVALLVKDDHTTTGMTIKPDGAAYTATVIHGNPFQITIDGSVFGPGSTDSKYVDVKKIYDDVVVKVFGLNYDLIGAYLRDKYFTDLVS
ncbi:MAG TPA: hypothetical protein PLH38_04830, partial [Clostridia bacterium]|nr:hypothetical protein [Clostridia bacterium]